MKNTKNRSAAAAVDSQDVIGPQLSFAAAEAYKLLRTNLLFALPDENRCRVFGVTSALRGEGKTTTSLNLAYSMAQTGKRVLLIEADLRLPNIARRLNIDNSVGLSYYLSGLCRREEAVHDSGLLETLKIIPCGAIPPNPSELLGSKRMGAVTQELMEHFDFIIFDLPPVTAVSDALAISPILDGMVVITRQNYVDRRALDETLRQLKLVNAKILGFVMTASTTHSGSYKKYGKKYGGNYGYYRKGSEDKK